MFCACRKQNVGMRNFRIPRTFVGALVRTVNRARLEGASKVVIAANNRACSVFDSTGTWQLFAT